MNSRILPTLAACLGLTLADSALAGNNSTESPEQISTWDGLFTQVQADRGKLLMDRHCASCHGPTLKGTPAAPGIAGVEMLYFWNGRTLAELLEYLQVSMPPGQAGNLTDQQYTDIIATILKFSGFPAGQKDDLVADPEMLERTYIMREDPGKAEQ